MASTAINNLKNIMARIKKATDEAISYPRMRELGLFSRDLIVKRTRLGYGVDREFGTKERLKPLSLKYRQYRKSKPFLINEATSPAKSNLTFTGQLLDSMDITKVTSGSVTIAPTGVRLGSSRITNLKVAEYQAEQGRSFNLVSALEFQQILRFYRKTFGDLLNKQHLLG